MISFPCNGTRSIRIPSILELLNHAIAASIAWITSSEGFFIPMRKMVIAVLSHAVNPGNSKVLAFTGTRVSLSYCCAHAVLTPFCTYCVFSTTASPLSYDFCIALSIPESSHKKLESPCSMFLNSSKVPVVTSSLKVTASTSQPLQPPLSFCVESR